MAGRPVGLTTARLLQMKGANVSVYERDRNETARISGGTLDLHKETGQKTLKKAGLFEEFSQVARPVGMSVGNMQGKVIFTMKPDTTKPEIDRPALRKILLNSLYFN